jgi:hypothetical protein
MGVVTAANAIAAMAAGSECANSNQPAASSASFAVTRIAGPTHSTDFRSIDGSRVNVPGRRSVQFLRFQMIANNHVPQITFSCLATEHLKSRLPKSEKVRRVSSIFFVVSG